MENLIKRYTTLGLVQKMTRRYVICDKNNGRFPPAELPYSLEEKMNFENNSL